MNRLSKKKYIHKKYIRFVAESRAKAKKLKWADLYWLDGIITVSASIRMNMKDRAKVRKVWAWLNTHIKDGHNHTISMKDTMSWWNLAQYEKNKELQRQMGKLIRILRANGQTVRTLKVGPIPKNVVLYRDKHQTIISTC